MLSTYNHVQEYWRGRGKNLFRAWMGGTFHLENKMKLFWCFCLLVSSFSVRHSQGLVAEETSTESAVVVFITTPVAIVLAGSTVTIPVWVNSKDGNVNAVSGSITFDPSVLAYTSCFVTRPGATYFPNAEHLNEGKLGYLYGLPAGTSLPVGTSSVFYLYFQVLKTAVPLLGVGNQPVAQEVTDPGPKNLLADFVSFPSPVTREWTLGPSFSFGKTVYIGVEGSSYPGTVWRIDHDGAQVKVHDCDFSANGRKKCSDEPVGGGYVGYYLEFDMLGKGKLQTLPRYVKR